MKTHKVLFIVLIFSIIDAMWANSETTKAKTLRLDFKDELLLEAGSITGIDRSSIFKQVAITSDNQLVIATWEDAFLFNNSGPPIRIGKNGPGDGYYSGVHCLSIDSSNNIYLVDGYTAYLFDKYGKFKKNIPIMPKFSHLLPCLYISPSGDIFAFFRYFKTTPVKLVLEHRDIDGKEVADIHNFNDKSGHVHENRAMTTIYHEYMEDYYMVPVLNKEICFASNLEYRLHFYNLENKTPRAVIIAEKPVKISNDELNAFKDLFKSRYDSLIFPPHRPFFQGLLSDEQGRIYVIRTKPIMDDDKKGRTLDVFNRKGNFLFRCHIPCMPLYIHGGMIFYVKNIKGDPSQLRVLKIMNHENVPY